MARARDKQTALENQIASGLLFSNQPATSVTSTSITSGITDINLDDIIPYHREKIVYAEEEFTIFYDYSSEKLQQLAENIEENGLIEPIIVFPSLIQPGKYETLAGKQRTNATRLLNKTKHPEDPKWSKIKSRVLDAQEVSADDYAYGDTVYVSTNLERRDQLKISELAMAYEMEFQARKHVGKKSENNLGVNEEIAQRMNKSINYVRNIRRIQPQFLIKELIEMVDDEQLNLSIAALFISYIPHNYQRIIVHWACKRADGDRSRAKAYLAKKLNRANCKSIKSLLESRGEGGELTDADLEGIFESSGESFRAPSAQTIKKILPARLWTESQDEIASFLQNAVTEYLQNHPEMG